MKYLLYAILAENTVAIPEECRESVFLLSESGLSIVLSPVHSLAPAPSTRDLLAYEAVIAAFHARGTVIPLRYGSMLDSDSEIQDFLARHCAEYNSLLEILRGQTEIGLRILSPEPEPNTGLDEMYRSQGPGARYLAAIRQRLHGIIVPHERTLIGEINGAVTGLYTLQQSEICQVAEQRLLSLYYLAPKDAALELARRLRNLNLRPKVKSLVTGPWPPYNFVTPEYENLKCGLTASSS